MQFLKSANILAFFAITSMIALIAIVLYTAFNASGHTGIDPYWFLYIFVPALSAGLLSRFVTQNNEDLKLPGQISLLAGIIGIAFLIYLDKSNTLLHYEVWISRGMP